MSATGENAARNAEVVIYTDDVSGYVDSIPTKASAIVFATDDSVIAEIDGHGTKIVVSGDGKDFINMTGNSNDEVFSGGGDDLVFGGSWQGHPSWWPWQ